VNEKQRYGTFLYMSLLRSRQVRKAESEIGTRSILFTRCNKEKHTIDVEVFKKVAKGFIKGSINELTTGDDPSSKEVVKVIAKATRDVPYEDLYSNTHL
jgi:hypothetical protein